MNLQFVIRTAMVVALAGMTAACTQQSEAPPIASEPAAMSVEPPQQPVTPIAAEQSPPLTTAEREQQRIANEVVEGLNIAAPFKLGVSETFYTYGEWPNSNAAAGLDEVTDPVRIVVGEAGVITLIYHAPEEIAGKSLLLLPQADQGVGAVTWTCTSIDVPAEFLPESCM